MASGSKHSAPGQAAGYLFQLERALRHLAFSGTGAVVGIETLDDVVSAEASGTVTYEQDKHSVSGANPISDRSKGLWKSLKIWTDGVGAGDIDLQQAQFLLVTNQTITGGAAFLLMTPLKQRDDGWAQGMLDALKLAGKHPPADLKEFIEGVFARPDQELIALLKRVLVVDGSTGGDGSQLVGDFQERLHLDPQNAADILRGLLGWLHDLVMQAWRSGHEALIGRESFGRQLRFLQNKFQSQRLFRETAAALVPVKEEDRKAHRDDLFVQQLLWIGIDEDDDQLLDAIDDFLKCGTERTRLGQQGNIPPEEFRAFDDRLVKRWKTTFTARARAIGGLSDAEIEALGREILAHTLEHRESLAGQQTQEFYLTTGAYHQLANEPKEKPRVGWHPKYKEICQPTEAAHEAPDRT